MIFYTKFDSQFCGIILAGDEVGLCHLHLDTGQGKRIFKISDDWILNDDFFKDTKSQIEEYFRGERTEFEVKLNPHGTEFQKKIWNELKKIPYGSLCTYGDIAKTAGNEKACRAVGMANSKNPIPLIVPCHRVIGTNGKLTGFAHGLDIKEKLITFEKENAKKCMQ